MVIVLCLDVTKFEPSSTTDSSWCRPALATHSCFQYVIWAGHVGSSSAKISMRWHLLSLSGTTCIVIGDIEMCRAYSSYYIIVGCDSHHLYTVINSARWSWNSHDCGAGAWCGGLVPGPGAGAWCRDAAEIQSEPINRFYLSTQKIQRNFAFTYFTTDVGRRHLSIIAITVIWIQISMRMNRNVPIRISRR